MITSIRKVIDVVFQINKKNRYKYSCIKICLIYFISGCLWIYFSDEISHILASNNDMLFEIDKYKGWLFVLVTSIVLYLLINRLLKKVSLTEERYKTLVNQMQQGLSLYEGRYEEEDVMNYRLLDANKSFEKLTTLKKEDCLGKSLAELYPSLAKEYIKKLNYTVKTGKSTNYQRHYENTDRYHEVIAYRPKKLQIAIIINDITKRKHAQEELKASEYSFRKLFESSSDAILIVENYRVIDCNFAMIQILGYESKSSLLGKNPEEFSPEKQPDGEISKSRAEKMYKIAMKNGKCKFEWWYKKVDGSQLPVEVMITTILLNGKKVFHFLLRDISQRKEMEEKLEYLSYHDQLTGLYNRRFYEEELIRLDVEENLPLTIVMGDVNGLKLVNDSFGHVKGDELLNKVVSVLKNGCRNQDIIARLAGDEFVMLLPKTDFYEAEKIVENIRHLASKEKIGSVEVSIALGYDTKTIKEEEMSDKFKKAEDYMYKKKLLESPSIRGKTVSAIINTLYEKNKSEEEHSLRVSLLCESMGRAINLAEDGISELKTVGLLHDIGKIAIEEKILNKSGKLTNEEWKEIKRHPEIGYRILSTVNEMSEMSEYVLAHHERWDGKGYPKGLKGTEIPLQSRIIAIADSYDVMVSGRSYRKSLSQEFTIQELKTNAGIQFDPHLVEIFIGKVLNKPSIY